MWPSWSTLLESDIWSIVSSNLRVTSCFYKFVGKVIHPLQKRPRMYIKEFISAGPEDEVLRSKNSILDSVFNRKLSMERKNDMVCRCLAA